MTPNDVALFGLHRSSMILHGMTDELAPSEWLVRVSPGTNPAAWIVGHLIAIEHMALGHLGGGELPELPDADFAGRHAKGSTPGEADDYGDVTRLLPLFDAHRKLMVDRVAALPPAEFDRPLDHPTFKQLGQLLALIPVHTTLHCGQISTIRRAIGKPPIF